MAHTRGHIVNPGDGSQFLPGAVQQTGIFYRYFFKILDYGEETTRFQSTDSYDSDRGDTLIILSQEQSLDLKGREFTDQFDIVLKSQDQYSYSIGWILDGKNNWLVYDKDDQEYDHDH